MGQPYGNRQAVFQASVELPDGTELSLVLRLRSGREKRKGTSSISF